VSWGWQARIGRSDARLGAAVNKEFVNHQTSKRKEDSYLPATPSGIIQKKDPEPGKDKGLSGEKRCNRDKFLLWS